jgi:molybdate transport system substrate-binding protein
MAAAPITGISSMATRAVLAELAAVYEQQTGLRVSIESVGGVDAARRVQAGEAFDVVLLAADAIDKLMASGAARAGSRVDFVRSPVAVAVRAGASHPDIGSEAALHDAVLAASRIGYSTGPSGQHLLKLFERWGVLDRIKPRTVQAPPGVPVAGLLARGEVELGFQQLSELMHAGGIDVLGPLPAAAAFITTFSGAVCSRSSQPAAAAALLEHLASSATAHVKHHHGMEPAP